MVKKYCLGCVTPNQKTYPCGLILDIKVVKNKTGRPWDINLYCPVCGMEMGSKKDFLKTTKEVNK